MCSRTDLERLARIADRVPVPAGVVVTGSGDRWAGIDVIAKTDVDAIVVRRGENRSINGLAV